MTGIIIGRFQVPSLTPGHLHLIATSLRECDNTVILLGTPRPEEDWEEYGAPARIRMIRKIFPNVRIQILHDLPNDQDWSTEVDTIAETYGHPILYHSKDSFKNHYVGRLPLKEVEWVPGFIGTDEPKN
jgi:nicotinamide mononucleotide adenylyltransferase